MNDLTGYDKSRLHKHTWLPSSVVNKNTRNPNSMDTKTFNLLVENIVEKGITEPIEVREVGEEEGIMQYRIISGHHRFDACKHLKWDTVPCVINKDPEMDDEKETFQLVRMNAISGNLDPEKFVDLYNKALESHEPYELQSLFGFSDEREFKKLLKQTEEGLPDELKDSFKEGSKEIKTMEELAHLLQELFANYGDTLQYGYMMFDYGGKYSIWVRMFEKDLAVFKKIAGICIGKDKAIDDVLRVMFKELVDKPEKLEELISRTPDRDPNQRNHLELKQPGMTANLEDVIKKETEVSEGLDSVEDWSDVDLGSADSNWGDIDE